MSVSLKNVFIIKNLLKGNTLLVEDAFEGGDVKGATLREHLNRPRLPLTITNERVV